MSLLRTTVVVASVVLAIFATAGAAPSLIDYQGYLESSSGDPIDTTISITFKIYTDSSGGTQKWTETQSSVVITGGLFNVTLGSSTAISDSVFNQDERWLRITIGSSDMTPTRIVSTAYSMRVNTVDGASGGTISGDFVAGKGLFGSDCSNSGTSAFAAGANSAASGNYSVVSGGIWGTASTTYATVGGGQNNKATGYASTVAGGAFDSAKASYATVGGGYYNTAGGNSSFIGGGRDNSATDSCATVGGGKDNTANHKFATVSGGLGGTASLWYSTVAGGRICTANGNASTVGGGDGNNATEPAATVAGGSYNTASGVKSTVPGGYDNTAAGIYSFAAGRSAKANHHGCFVWGDSTNADVASTGINQFIVRASGGLWFGTTSSPSIPAGRFINTSTGGYLTTGGTWTNSSDRNLKENLIEVDGLEILQKVSELPLYRWNYKAESNDSKHIGPMAQDFHAVFGLGNDDKSISTIDPAGIALAAIQELNRVTLELKQKTSEIDELRADLKEMRLDLTRLCSQQSTGAPNLAMNLSSEQTGNPTTSDAAVGQTK